MSQVNHSKSSLPTARQLVYRPLLHRFASFTAVGTLFLIALGGHVTSTESGLAVPDWPTSYGFNMFLFPWTRMVGGIFWEHSHRLVASGIGLLTLILTMLFFYFEKRFWLKMLMFSALLAVITQGLLGGLRVVWLKAELGIVHAAIAQIFFCMLCLLAWFTSKQSIELENRKTISLAGNASSSNHVIDRSEVAKVRHTPFTALLRSFSILIFLVFIQLILGASMRHEHAGLAVPDFPKVYGAWTVQLDPGSIEKINQLRQNEWHMPPTSALQIILHLSHRILGIVLLILFGIFWFRVAFKKKYPFWLQRGFTIWLIFILIQVMLGIATIHTQKAAEIATTHVAIGASILAWGILMSARLWQERRLLT